MTVPADGARWTAAQSSPAESSSRLGAGAPAGGPEQAHVRVVLDLRPLQEPDRAPTTAAYLERLLAAFAADPVAGESFVLVLNARQADPSADYPGLPVAARRRVPSTRLLRSGALTIDSFLLRAAELGTRWGAERGGAQGTVYHTAGGAAPIVSGLPIVATVLDLAPWELPNVYQASPAARLGQRLRARVLQDAAAVVVASEASGRAARRLLHVPPARIHVVPLAAPAHFQPAVTMPVAATFTGTPTRTRRRSRASAAPAPAEPIPVPGFSERLVEARTWLGLSERYFVFFARYDARKDLGTLFEALALLAAEGRPQSLAPETPWPPRVLLVGASPDDRAALARRAARTDVGELIAYAPRLEEERLATLVAGARAALLPAVSEATGLPAIESLACGTPVVASSVGALPELVGDAGILVEPRDPARLAVALRSAWSDDAIHARIQAAARERAAGHRRTWVDVARETRAAYAAALAGSGRSDASDREAVSLEA